jgi:integrase
MPGTNYRLGKIARSPYWHIIWSEAGGSQRLSTRTTNRAEAETVLRDFLTELNAPPPAEQLTVEDACAYYLSQLAEHKAKRQGYSLANIRRHLGSYRMDEIDRPLCRDYLASRMREKPSLSRATLRDELRALRTALIMCERDNLILKAPWIEAPGKADPRERFLTESEAERLLAECRTPHLWVFAILALYTGARAGAILGLTWDKVDFERGLIDYRVPGRERTKKGRAVVPMSDVVRAALLRELARQRDSGTCCPYVVQYARQRLTQMKHAFARAAKRAGLDDVTPNVLRHTFATWACERGADPREVAKALGHTDDKMVQQVYAKHRPEYLRGVVNAVAQNGLRTDVGAGGTLSLKSDTNGERADS